MSTDWSKRYLELARQIASWSKDPSKQVGAVAIGNRGQVLAQGYNGFPRGVLDTSDRYNDKQLKLKMVVHAEMNVIFNASYTGTSLAGSHLYVYGLPVCSECAKGIIQVGFTHVSFATAEPLREDSKWSASWHLTRELFREAGVTYDHFILPLPQRHP